LKQQRERAPRARPRLASKVAFQPGPNPGYRVFFNDMALILVHDGWHFRHTGMYFSKGGTVFPATDIPKYELTADQQAFIDAMMLGRSGLGPAEGFAA